MYNINFMSKVEQLFSLQEKVSDQISKFGKASPEDVINLEYLIESFSDADIEIACVSWINQDC